MQINPLQLFVIPMGIALAALFIAAWLYDIRAASRQKKTKGSMYRCLDCRRIYVRTQHTPLAPCPKCGKQNAAVRQR